MCSSCNESCYPPLATQTRTHRGPDGGELKGLGVGHELDSACRAESEYEGVSEWEEHDSPDGEQV